MPRKKKTATQEPLGELLGLRMPQEDRQKTLTALSNSPHFYYALWCQTGDQIEQFISIKRGYQFIKADLASVFSGEENTATMPDQGKELWQLMSDRYLAWYLMVRAGWRYLASEWEEDDRLAHFQVETPGDALVKLLESESNGFMQPAFSTKYRFAPSQHRRWAKNEHEIARGVATKKAERSYKSEVNIKGLHLEAFVFGGVIEETCRKNAKDDERLRLAIKNYDSVMGALDGLAKLWLHPRKDIKGYEWRDGVKYKLERGGKAGELFCA